MPFSCPHCDHTTPHTIDKYCSKCETTLPHPQFGRDKKHPDGLRIWCKRCRNTNERNRIQERAQDPVLCALDLANHLARQKRYKEKDPQHVAEIEANWRTRNNAKVNANRRAQYPRKRLTIQARNKKRKALKRGAPGGDIPAEVWEAIKAHYGNRCVYCDRTIRQLKKALVPSHMPLLTQDHITPVSQGGPHIYMNIVPACPSCNGKKSDGAVLKPVQPLLLIPC